MNREEIEKLADKENEEKAPWSTTNWKDGFIEGYTKALPKWMPISYFVKYDGLNYIVRWHKIYNCEITVWYNFNELGPMVWYEKTLNTKWPEDAFLPIYRYELPMPTISNP